MVVVFGGGFRGGPRFNCAFHAVGRWGGANDADLEVCGIDEGKLVREQLRKSAIDRGFDPPGTLRNQKSPGKNVCYAARPYNFTVSADGKMMKCTVLLD